MRVKYIAYVVGVVIPTCVPKMIKETYKYENKAEYSDNSSNVESYNTVICSRYCLRVRHGASKTMFMAQFKVKTGMVQKKEEQNFFISTNVYVIASYV